MSDTRSDIDSSPSAPAVFTAGGSDNLGDFLRENSQEIESGLAGKGAVLMRGFAVTGPDRFDAAIAAYGGANFAYAKSLSNAVRVNVTPRVFTANEAPPDTAIYLHHEMAQTPIYPSKLFFYCEIAPQQGGETPLCRSDILLQHMREIATELVDRFGMLGVRYTNAMPSHDDAGSGQGRSWKSTLGVATVMAAEARLQQLGYAWKWLAEGALQVTTPRLDAIRQLPNGRSSFFNQLIAAYRGWSDTRNEAVRSVQFGDGSTIEADDMAQIIALSDMLTYDHAWQASDVVLVDNFLTMHGRRPFAGKRRVLASLLK